MDFKGAFKFLWGLDVRDQYPRIHKTIFKSISRLKNTDTCGSQLYSTTVLNVAQRNQESWTRGEVSGDTWQCLLLWTRHVNHCISNFFQIPFNWFSTYWHLASLLSQQAGNTDGTSDGTGLVAMFDAELPLIVKDCFIYWSGVAIFHRVSFLELHFCALPQLTRNTSRQELIDLKPKKNDVEIGRMRHETQENEFENQHDELRQNHKNHRNCLRLATHCFTTKPSLHQLAEWQRASVMVFDFWRLRKKL